MRDRVQFIEEDDARRDLLRLLEDHADRLLALPDPLRHDLGSLDGNEVRLRFRRDRLRQERLAGARRAIEEDAARRADPHAFERIRVLEGHLDGFAEFHLHFLEATDVGPAHPRNFHEDLPHRARLDFLQGLLEVVGGDPHLLECLRGDRLVQIDVREVAPEGLHGGLPRERRKVGTNEPVADVRELGQERVSVFLHALDRHAAGVNLQDFLPSHPVGHSDLDLAVETAGSAQRGIDRLVPVRRADHDDLAAAGESVHQGEELGDDPPLDLAGDLLPFRRDGVEFVDE